MKKLALVLSVFLGLALGDHVTSKAQVPGPFVSNGGGSPGLSDLFYGDTSGAIFGNATVGGSSTTTGGSNPLSFSSGTIAAGQMSAAGQCVVLECAARWSAGANVNTLRIVQDNTTTGVLTAVATVAGGNASLMGFVQARLCYSSASTMQVMGIGMQGGTLSAGIANGTGQSPAGGDNISLTAASANTFICDCNAGGSGVTGNCNFHYFRARPGAL